ncbi:MAG: hypothetical protein H7256_05740 [Bdellovibrio sp.]|nr:hypothetical protein [Bdellovibrio sp.]
MKQLTEKFESYFLLNWIPFESDMLSEMVYRMKSDKCFGAWMYYAEKAADELAENLNIEQIDYIIPIPGSKKTSVHSHIFAQLLGRALRKPILDILVKTQTIGEQKRKNKTERLNKTIRLHEQFTRNLNLLGLARSHVLVVDDILTTGSSFIQSVEALGPVRKATLLTLFHRTANSNTVLVS